MGKSGSGKTSMRSIIFANYLGNIFDFEIITIITCTVNQLNLLFMLPSARDTMRLGPTRAYT
jgi:hypothetical protein